MDNVESTESSTCNLDYLILEKKVVIYYQFSSNIYVIILASQACDLLVPKKVACHFQI